MPNTPPGPFTHADLREWFGDIDIYLFDQLLKGRLTPGMRVLDAGCGGGRNLVYFLRGGYAVCGVDRSDEAVAHVRSLASALAPHLPADNFRVEPVEKMSFADADFDVVISSAVLHFARDEGHWQAMVREMWRVLGRGGIFFARLASGIGLEGQTELLEGRRYRLPDGSARFLVDEQMLTAAAESLGGEMLEPLKTVVVQNMRSMSTWCLRKT
ncbi:MAG TPA: class I SAM-dependent methyltransferase [Pyrinomonadaceae bacterium]|jgi:SAM-dependent methyltransferase